MRHCSSTGWCESTHFAMFEALFLLDAIQLIIWIPLLSRNKCVASLVLFLESVICYHYHRGDSFNWALSNENHASCTCKHLWSKSDLLSHSSRYKVIHIIFFLFLNENICCGYLLEMPWQGTSNEFLHVFSWRNKKNISTFKLKNALAGAMQFSWK